MNQQLGKRLLLYDWKKCNKWNDACIITTWGIDQNRPYSAEGKLILFDKLHKIVLSKVWYVLYLIWLVVSKDVQKVVRVQNEAIGYTSFGFSTKYN